MRPYAVVCILLMTLLNGVSAQEETDLHLSNQLFFHSTVSYNGIFFVQQDSTPRGVFSTQNAIFSYTWSPDDSKIAIVTNKDGILTTEIYTSDNYVRQPETYRLYLLDLETYQSTLVAGTSYKHCVAWSRDSHLFVTISSLFQEREFPFPSATTLQIYDLNSERISEFDLTTEPKSALGCPTAWSNDGQWIAMKLIVVNDEGNYPAYQTGMAVVELSTGELHTVGVSDSPVYDVRSLVWSPDDSWVAVGTQYSAFSDIRLFSFDTGEEFIITIDGLPLSDPIWRVLSG